jgi:7-cyano-7-deazaguanine synthase
MKALVLLSGGLDSTVALHWSLREHAETRSLAIDYGQRHMIELNIAGRIAKSAGVAHERLFASATGFGAVSSLVAGATFVASAAPVLPARNAVLLAIAFARAAQHGCDAVVIGACADDAADFPDCRPEFMRAAETTLCLAIGQRIELLTPLIYKSKAEIGALARELGDDAYDAACASWSCYDPRKSLPCGECRACAARERSGIRAIGGADA